MVIHYRRSSFIAFGLGAFLLIGPMALADQREEERTATLVKPNNRALKAIPLGNIRRVFISTTGKYTVIKDQDSLSAALQGISDFADIPDTVRTAALKQWDGNSDHEVDWREFRHFLYSGKAAPESDASRAPRPAKAGDVATREVVEEDAPVPPAQRDIVEQSGGRSFSVPGPVEEFAGLYKDDPELFKAALTGDANGDGVLDRAEMDASWQAMKAIRKQRVLAEAPAADGGGPGEVSRKPRQPAGRRKTSAEQREAVLESHDANEDGVLQSEEWKNYLGDLRLQRRQRAAGSDGALDPTERLVWQSNDNGLLWSYSFDEDRNGVLDDHETAKFSERMVTDPSFIRSPPPLLDELGSLEDQP